MPWNKGLTKDTSKIIKKIAESRIGNTWGFKKGHIPWNKGKKCVRISQKMKKRLENPRNHNNWQGGEYINGQGYVMVKNKTHPFRNPRNYVRKHRFIMEEYLGRYLKPAEIVHHIDDNKTNNKIKNLRLFENSKQHSRYHRLRLSNS